LQSTRFDKLTRNFLAAVALASARLLGQGLWAHDLVRFSLKPNHRIGIAAQINASPSP
jgi:hypothetical protein